MKSAADQLDELDAYRSSGDPGSAFAGVGLSASGYDRLGVDPRQLARRSGVPRRAAAAQPRRPRPAALGVRLPRRRSTRSSSSGRTARSCTARKRARGREGARRLGRASSPGRPVGRSRTRTATASSTSATSTAAASRCSSRRTSSTSARRRTGSTSGTRSCRSREVLVARSGRRAAATTLRELPRLPQARAERARVQEAGGADRGRARPDGRERRARGRAPRRALRGRHAGGARRRPTGMGDPVPNNFTYDERPGGRTVPVRGAHPAHERTSGRRRRRANGDRASGPGLRRAQGRSQPTTISRASRRGASACCSWPSWHGSRTSSRRCSSPRTATSTGSSIP